LEDSKSRKIRKHSGPTCQPQRLLKRLTPVTRACVRDTACGDAAVTICHQWPPPHVVTTLSSLKVEQREVSPFCLRPRARPTITLLYRSLSSTLCQCQPPPSAARTRRCIPELHLHAAVLVDHTIVALNYFSVLPVASSPPPPFLRELTDDQPLWPSPCSVFASASTIPP
jgi:hypothetical protein